MLSGQTGHTDLCCSYMLFWSVCLHREVIQLTLPLGVAHMSLSAADGVRSTFRHMFLRLAMITRHGFPHTSYLPFVYLCAALASLVFVHQIGKII